MLVLYKKLNFILAPTIFLLFSLKSANAAYGVPDVNDLLDSADEVVMGQRIYSTERRSIYIHPLISFKGGPRNLMEICSLQSPEGYKPSLNSKVSIFFLKKSGECYFGTWGYNSEIAVFDEGVHKNCFDPLAIYRFSNYKTENVAALAKIFNISSDLLEYNKYTDCRLLS